MRSHWHLLVLAVAVVVCVGLAQTRPGHALLGAAGLYERPATYAELAFTKPGALPSTLPKSGAQVNVSFGIHNVSGDLQSYDWSIAIVHSGVSQVKAKGTALTPAQGRTAITQPVAAACDGGRLQVVVRLAAPAEAISFWMMCPTAGATVKASGE